ncbi:Ig-like domain-containing protein [Archangium sp.]|jgi:hypothetical protein|uniref:Ig-like domain-containing protein n=1 Tax=Archangium sp. TaxID=1872627 RepID=UPI002ED9B080
MRTLVTLLVAGLVLASCEPSSVDRTLALSNDSRVLEGEEEGATAPEATIEAAATTTPTVSLSLPYSPTPLTGTVTVRVFANGLTESTRYEVLLDGNPFLEGSIHAPYGDRETSWNTRTVANGPHTLVARLKGYSGNVLATTPVMNVTIDQDLIAPTVSFLAPASGVTVQETVNVQATAADDRGVYMVRVLVDGVVQNADFGAPYAFDALYLKHLSNGPHTLTLEAWDFSQNVTTSEPITLFVDNDRTAPSVALTSPASGTVATGGPVTLSADASDDRGLARVVFLLNGSQLAEDETPPYSVEWNSNNVISAEYTLAARAYDLAGNVTTTASIPLTVFKPGTAVFDPVMGVPVCDTVGTRCDTARLVEERNTAEPHAPNTLDGCADGPGLDQVYSERIQRIIVTRVGGEFLAENRRVRVDVLASGDPVGEDSLDLFVASDATNPSWTYVTSVPGAIYGTHWLSAEFVLPAGNLQAIRAQFQAVRTLPVSSCSAGSCDDHDDLVFAVGPPTDAFPPTVKLTTPYDNAPYSYALVGGVVRVAATAEDDMAVERVEFYVDGTLMGTDTSAPYEVSWSSTAVADGSHSLTAKAYDPAGRSTISKAVVVNTDNTGPSATLRSPAQGALLRGNVVLDAMASDSNGVTKVEYYSGETLLSVFPISPQTSHAGTWYTGYKNEGVHTLTARAVDSLGNVGISAPVVVTIDNFPPSTEFTAPQAYAWHRGTVQVSANATDTNGVSKVEFYAGDLFIGTATTAPYTVSWDSTTGPDGHVELKARAYDRAGNVSGGPGTGGHPVYVDNTAPSVALTSPTNGASLMLSTTLQASASDNEGVTQVVFYDGATVIGTDTTAPYSVSWNLLFVAKGSHTLTARAHDAVGNVRTSVPVTVKVN